MLGKSGFYLTVFLNANVPNILIFGDSTNTKVKYCSRDIECYNIKFNSHNLINMFKPNFQFQPTVVAAQIVS